MKNIKNKTLLKILINFIFSLSVSLLSLYLMIEIPTSFFKYLTLIIVFLFSNILFYKKYDDITKLIIKNKKNCIITLILSGIIFYELTKTSNIEMVSNRILEIKCLFYLSFPGLTLIITLSFVKIKDWLKDFIKRMDSFEKKAYIITSIVLFSLLLIAYFSTDFFYSQYDKIYSLDSGWVYENMFANSHYYDIRHPLMSIFTFPIYAIVNFIFSSSLKPIILQFLNIQLLIIIGLELKRLTKNKFVYIFYILSFSSILFSLFFEKYILCTFLVVTYVYNIFINKKSSNTLPVFIAGLMPTNIFVVIVELFKSDKFKNKIKNIIYIGVISLLIIIFFGRIHCLFNGYDEIKKMKATFGSTNFTIVEKLNSTTKMIQHSFIAVDSDKQSNVYIWNDITKGISFVGIFVVIIILFGFWDIYKEKNKIYYSFISAFIFSIILFTVLNWSVHESPLFSICFSWAIIPLFIFGLEKIFTMFKINKKNYKYIYFAILLIMTLINTNQIIKIFNFITI